jgi:tRNA pseudouridine38-40 synthase
MANWKFFYLIRIEFLGFRYHGWQVQPNQKTVEGMINKTFPFVLNHENFKVIGCGRTDAKVSAEDFVFELFINEQLDEVAFMESFNSNLPFDIRAKSIEQTTAEFNIIQHPKTKEYHYNFSFGEKTHPFNAPFIINIDEELNLELMKQAAELYKGIHNFKRYTTKDKEYSSFEREIIKSTIESNNTFQGAFFPSTVYTYKIKSKGFLTYQVRMMMAAILEVGKGHLSLEDIKETLLNPTGETINTIAPSSGLVLHKVNF